jgi:hypothetical protein
MDLPTEPRLIKELGRIERKAQKLLLETVLEMVGE